MRPTAFSPPPPSCIQTGVHMWHHEDAGVGFNVVRNAIASAAPTRASPLTPTSHPHGGGGWPAGGGGGGTEAPHSIYSTGREATTYLVALPGHYNDPYIIERTRHNDGKLTLHDEYWAEVRSRGV